MLFLVALQNFVVLHTRSDTRPCFSIEDENGNTDDRITLSWADDDGAYLYFPLDAEISIHASDASGFSVVDVEGVEIYFNAYTPAKLSEPQGPRDINLDDIRLEVTEPNRLWVKVGKFDVLLNHTDEGIAVDVWPWVPKDCSFPPDEPLATCYAFDSDADDAVMDPDEVAHARMDAEGSE